MRINTPKYLSSLEMSWSDCYGWQSFTTSEMLLIIKNIYTAIATSHLSFLYFCILRVAALSLCPRPCKWRCDVGGGTPGISLCHAVMTGAPSVTEFVTLEPCHHLTGDTHNQIDKHLDNFFSCEHWKYSITYIGKVKTGVKCLSSLIKSEKPLFLNVLKTFHHICSS